jgi:dipeptidase E
MDDARKAKELNDYSGLHIIDFYPLPHYGNPPFTEAAESICQEYFSKIDLLPIRNT